MSNKELLQIIQQQTQYIDNGDTYFTFTHLTPIVEFINAEDKVITETELADIALDNGYGILNVFPEETFPTGLVAYPIEMRDPETQLLLWYADMYGIVPTFESYIPNEGLKEELSEEGGGFSYKDIGDFDTYEGILIQGLEEVAGSEHYSKYDEPQNCIITPGGLFIEASYEYRDYFHYISTTLKDFRNEFEELARENGQEVESVSDYDILYLSENIEDTLNDTCVIIDTIIDTINHYEYYLTFPIYSNLTEEQINRLPQVVDALKDSIQGELVIMSVPATKFLDVDLSKGSKELVAIAKYYKETGVLKDVDINEDFVPADFEMGETGALLDIETRYAQPNITKNEYGVRYYITPGGIKVPIKDVGISHANMDVENIKYSDLTNEEYLLMIFRNMLQISQDSDRHYLDIYLPHHDSITEEQIQAFAEDEFIRELDKEQGPYLKVLLEKQKTYDKLATSFEHVKVNGIQRAIAVLQSYMGTGQLYEHEYLGIDFEGRRTNESFETAGFELDEEAFMEYIETVATIYYDGGISYETTFITPQGKFITSYFTAYNSEVFIKPGAGEVFVDSDKVNNFDALTERELYAVIDERCVKMKKSNEGLIITLPDRKYLTDEQINIIKTDRNTSKDILHLWNYEWPRVGPWIAVTTRGAQYQSTNISKRETEMDPLDWIEIVMRGFKETGEIENPVTITVNEAKADTKRFREWAGEWLFDQFNRLKPRLKGQERDIYYWMKKDISELKDKINELDNKPTLKQRREKAKEGAETLYEDSNWEVLKITTIEASCQYGSNTMWCISGEDAGEYFDTEDGEYYYFFINKQTRKKYAVAHAPERKVGTAIYSDTDMVLPYIKGAPRVQGLPDLSNPPTELVDNIRELGIHVKEVYGYEDIVEMDIMTDEELFDIPHEMGAPHGSVIMVDDGDTSHFIFIDGDYSNLSDITDEVNQMIISGNFDESVDGKPTKDELKRMAKKHKKANKKKGWGWWENPNAGNVKHNIDIFNHMMGANTGPHPLSQGYAEAGEGGVGESGGEGMGENLELRAEDTITKEEKYRWKPSKTARREFAQKMGAIDKYCQENNISQSATNDSYYFEVNGQRYRVSNHSVETSYINSGGKYHTDGREDDVKYIHAGKTRIIEIHKNLLAGKELDGNGNIIKHNTITEEFELTEKIEKHNELNPKLWNGMELKPEVKQRAFEIVDDFVENLKEDGIELPIKDVIVIGSNASYNYSDTSDFDLHIIFDNEKLKCPTEVYPLLYSAYRSIYNKKHPIDFYGIGVEIYVEDGSTGMQLTKLNGVYSLNRGWLKEPSIDTVPDIDTLDMERIKQEFNRWEDKYFAIIDKGGMLDTQIAEDLTDIEAEQLEEIENYIEDIYLLRRGSIRAEGEYGVGNLVFKEIRAHGYLDSLKELKSELKAKALSLE